MSTPPQSIEAEKSVLGSILLDSMAVVKVADILQPNDFYFSAHAMIYGAILALYDSQRVIDILTVCNELEEQKNLESVGGASYVAEMTESVPTATHVTEYAQIVHEKAIRRRLVHAGNVILGLGYKEDIQPQEAVAEAEKELLRVDYRGRSEGFITMKDSMNLAYDELAVRKETPGVVLGVKSGLVALDAITGGFQKSDLVILAARPSIGKTSVALILARKMAQAKHPVGIFSLEMSEKQVRERLIAAESMVDPWKLRTGDLEKHEMDQVMEAMDKLGELPISIDDSASLTVTDIRTRATRLKHDRGLDVLVVDYLQLIQVTGKENRATQVGDVSRQLKILAKELECVVICLSQLNRSVEGRDNKVPNLSDLRDSGAIEQDADIVMFLYRDDYYNEASAKAGQIEFHIKKSRNGPTGSAVTLFDRQRMQISPLPISPFT